MAVRSVQEVVLKRQAYENNKKSMNTIKVRNWLKTFIPRTLSYTYTMGLGRFCKYVYRRAI